MCDEKAKTSELNDLIFDTELGMLLANVALSL